MKPWNPFKPFNPVSDPSLPGNLTEEKAFPNKDVEDVSVEIENVRADLADIANIVTVNPVANTYTLDMANQAIKNFKITSIDANTKSIVLTGINASLPLIQVNVLIVCTTGCTINSPTGVTFAAGKPTLTTGQSIWVTYESIDGGTTWAGYSVRRS
jgi:hypothetical protein